MTNCATLTEFQEKMLLSVCPQGSRIAEARRFQPQYVPGPIRVTIRTPNGSAKTLVVRLARHGSVEQEARLLPALARMSLPVPEVLAGPAPDPDTAGDPPVAVYTFLPGLNLQELSQRSGEDCRLGARLVVEAARRLASLTEGLRANPALSFVPTVTLSDQLQAVVDRGGPWLHERAFLRAVKNLQRALAEVPPLTVFTGGDYQPANFLTDGRELTGFVDFELACYQDFLVGFAKYPIYDIHPLNKAGFVDLLIEQERLAPRDFDIRLALGCLTTLQREIPVIGGDRDYRDHVLGLLAAACGSF